MNGVTADKRVDVGKGRRHAAGERGETGRRRPRIGPDKYDAHAGAAEASAGEHARVVALPTIGDDQYDGAPRPMPRRPWRSVKQRSARPIRVPPDQSGITAAARSSARSGLALCSARVSRVSRVPNTNTSACARVAMPGEQVQVRRGRTAPSSRRCREGRPCGEVSVRVRRIATAGSRPERVL